LKKSVDTNEILPYNYLVSGKQPNDKPTKTMNEIEIATSELEKNARRIESTMKELNFLLSRRAESHYFANHSHSTPDMKADHEESIEWHNEKAADTLKNWGKLHEEKIALEERLDEIS
jgi:hypothetical protein